MNEYLEKLSAERCSDMDLSNAVNVAQSIFDKSDAIDEKRLFMTRFCRVPNWVTLSEIDCFKANEWLVQNYQDKITDCCFIKRNSAEMSNSIIEKVKRLRQKTDSLDNNGDEIYLDDVYYFLFDDLLVHLNHNCWGVKILYRKTDGALVDRIVKKIATFKKDLKNQPVINLLCNGNNGFYTKTMKISRPEFSVEDNYNNDFLPVHQTILERLCTKNDKGLVLLHGKPGTGKTSYIRYLITETDKSVIFLPPNMAASITEPGLMNVLIDNPNSVFVIEDAENIILDRNRSNSSSVSALLNLADGVLSDCLNIQIVCSFNTDLSRVDSALTRKGRLIAKYEFLELDTPKAQALSNKLGYSSIISSPMTLAAVYHQNETEFVTTMQRRSMGFKIAV